MNALIDLNQEKIKQVWSFSRSSKKERGSSLTPKPFRLPALFSFLLILLVVFSGCIRNSPEGPFYVKQVSEPTKENQEKFSFEWYLMHYNETEDSLHYEYYFKFTNNYSEPLLLEKGTMFFGEDNSFDYAGKFCEVWKLPNRIDSGETVNGTIDCDVFCDFNKIPTPIFTIRFKFRDSNVFLQHKDSFGKLKENIELNLYNLKQKYFVVCGLPKEATE